MFKTRLLSGILLVIIALATIISGGYVLFGTLLIISLIGMSELYKILDIHKSPLGIVGYIAAIAYYFLGLIQGADYTYIFILFLLLLMFVYVFSYPKYRSEHVMLAFFGLFYVAYMLSFVFKTRMIPEHGAFLVWLVFLCSWGSDTCAYCVGMLIGKHKMAPVLSPKKSIEGGIGGIVGAALLSALYALAINHFFPGVSLGLGQCAIIGAVGSVISQVGDLAASAIKRNHDVKDYGKLIPGHGGILDRFDSVIFTAPIIYYLAIILM